MQKYLIVFPRGDTSKIEVVLAWDYEYDEYLRASRLEWTQNEYKVCADYARDLAIRNNLEYVTEDNEYYYLD